MWAECSSWSRAASVENKQVQVMYKFNSCIFFFYPAEKVLFNRQGTWLLWCFFFFVIKPLPTCLHLLLVGSTEPSPRKKRYTKTVIAFLENSYVQLGLRPFAMACFCSLLEKGAVGSQSSKNRHLNWYHRPHKPSQEAGSSTTALTEGANSTLGCHRGSQSAIHTD